VSTGVTKYRIYFRLSSLGAADHSQQILKTQNEGCKFEPVEDPRQHCANPFICSELTPSTLVLLLITLHDVADTKREVQNLTLLKVTAALPTLPTQV
jgi:hypothetical protein